MARLSAQTSHPHSTLSLVGARARRVRPNFGSRVAASLRAAGTAACLLGCTSRGYAARSPALSSTGVLRSGQNDALFCNCAVFAWAGGRRAARARRPHHLAADLHQATLPPPCTVTPQISSLHRLPWSMLRARAASPAMGVHASSLARVDSGPVVGTVAGSAVLARLSRCAALCVALRAPPDGHCG